MKVALIGLQNVGKSTLFNRLTESRNAITTSIAGTTRDRKRGLLQWEGIPFELIDTPGFKLKTQKLKDKTNEENLLEITIQLQADYALKEADVIAYLIDFQTGPTGEDYEIIKKLRKNKLKPILLVVNKTDKQKDRIEAGQYIRLGLGEPVAVSAANGRGTGELLDRITKLLPQETSSPSKEARPPLPSTTLAIVGKPNVGKSSLFNALLQEERVVVSPFPHTTRDPNDTALTYRNHVFTIIDTAGLRKKARVYESTVVEIFSVKKTLEVIKKAHVVLLLIDLTSGITVQDLKISALIKERGAGCIIIGNKWDTVENKLPKTMQMSRLHIYRGLKSLNWAPVIFSTVKDARAGKVYGVEKKYLDEKVTPPSDSAPLRAILDLTSTISHNRNSWIPQEELKQILLFAIKKQPPPKGLNNRRPHVKYLKQTDINPPTFMATLTTKQKLPEHYLNYLKGQLRERLKLWGTEIKIKMQEVH